MRVIFILGGFLKKRRGGNYGSDPISYLRILAGYHLYKIISGKDGVKLIVSGGKGIYKKIRDIPSVSLVMKQELIKLGLNPKEIKIDKTDFTYPELVYLKKYIDRNNTDKTFIISNAYHLPRIKTMIELLPTLKDLKKKVKLISAEKIVIKYNKKFISKIKKLNESSQMKKLIASEKRGVKDLKSGNYKFK